MLLFFTTVAYLPVAFLCVLGTLSCNTDLFRGASYARKDLRSAEIKISTPTL